MRKREKLFREESTSQERTMEAEQRRAAKEQMIALMQAGQRWQEAAVQAGIQVSRSTAYRLQRLVRTRGKAAFQDGRHGHPAKLRMAERTWLETYCHASPGTPSRVVQAALQERFGIQISIGYLNQVRASSGLRRRTQEAGKKTRSISTD
jgi:transposase